MRGVSTKLFGFAVNPQSAGADVRNGNGGNPKALSQLLLKEWKNILLKPVNTADFVRKKARRFHLSSNERCGRNAFNGGISQDPVRLHSADQNAIIGNSEIIVRWHVLRGLSAP